MREFKDLDQAQGYYKKSDEEMASIIGKSVSTYYRKKNNTEKFEVTEIIKISRELKLSLEEVNNIFFGGELTTW